MIQTDKITKMWAIAAMVIILLVAGVVFVLTPSNATPFVMQIQNYRLLYGMGEKLDLAPVARHHLKDGARPREVVRFFEHSGFDVKKIRKRGRFEGKRYDTTVVAKFNADGLVPALTSDYRFTLYFRNQKLVKMVGKIHKDAPPATTTVAASK